MAELVVPKRFEEPADFGYVDAHHALTQRLYSLIGEGEFEKIAKGHDRTKWQPLAEQACEDYARYLLLTSDKNPAEDEARRKVGRRFREFIGSPGRAAGSHGASVH